MKTSLARITILTFFLCCALCFETNAQGLPLASPQSVGMNAAKLEQIEPLVLADIADKKLPGAVVIVGHRGKIVYRKAFGNRSLVPTVEKMTVDTIFDVASLTKPVATATSIMILVEQGKLRLNDTIGKYIADIDDEQAKKVTIQQLLTHTSGYAPDFDLKEKWTGREGMLAALKKEKLRSAPGTKFVYSDIGFIVLGEIIERLTKGDVSQFSSKNIFDLLNPYPTTKFNCSWITVRCVFSVLTAPTENVKGQQSYLGSKFEGEERDGNLMLRGQVHDPTSFRMGGVAGHAGLFSTADDLARYCQMLLNGGVAPPVSTTRGSGWVGANPPATAGGTDKRRSRDPQSAIRNPQSTRILSAQTIAMMTRPYVVSEDGATRGLGWDMNTSFSSNRGELFPLGSFGHTGFTGTSIWIDRVSQTFVVFMSNRVHPDGKGDVTPLRAKVATVVASAIEDTPIEAYRLAESIYSSQVAAQIPKFISNKQLAISNQPGTTSVSVPPAVAGGLTWTVLNGIDVLERNGFKDLENKRIGLVTNHTGRNFAGKPTIDVLFEAKNVKLVSLFAPEHGIRGELDVAKIDDAKDEKTGLPIYSLYGETRRPKPEA